MIHARANRLRSVGQYRAPLTVTEQVGMASTLVAQFFDEARVSHRCAECAHDAGAHPLLKPCGVTACGCAGYRAPKQRMSEAKHAATAWAIAMDKLQLVQGRPTQILAVQEPAKPALKGLGLKLAKLTGGDAA